MKALIEQLTKLYKNDIGNFKSLVKNRPVIECSTSNEDCLFVYLLVKHLKPTNILEIGTFVGSTLFAIITACEENELPYTIHTIDNQDELKLEAELLHSVKIHKGWSSTVLQGINTTFDFVFSDANLDKETASILENLITIDTVFATHDFIPPYDKGISSVFNIIKNTRLKDNILIMPDHKCNWIYEHRSYQNMHENFSENYVKTTKFETHGAHNILGVNNCVAVIIPTNIIENLNLQKMNYSIAKNIISEQKLPLMFTKDNYIIFDDKLYIKSYGDNIIIENKFLHNLPYVNKIYSIL